MKIGIISMQGDVIEHYRAIEKACFGKDCDIVHVKTILDIVGCDGLIIPGGESTTIFSFLQKTGLDKKIVEFAKDNVPIMGTCAGAIILSKSHLGIMDIEIDRNFYGRQIDSFEAQILVGEKEFAGIFIRAPHITKVSEPATIYARYGENIVGAQQENIIALTFHPELGDDLFIHKQFVELVKRNLTTNDT